MKEETLTQAGLTVQEAQIYRALLAIKRGTISDLARESGLHRPAIYHVLPSLLEKRLVTMTPRGKQRVYVAESPARLAELFEERSGTFAETVRALREDYERSSDKPNIRFLDGKEAMRSALKDQMDRLKRGEKFYRYDAYDGNVDYESFRPRDYARVRDQKQWDQFVITNATLRRKSYKKRLNCASKVFPPEFDKFEYNIGQTIYNDTVIFDDFDRQTSLVIENPRFAAFQTRVFEMLYQKLPGHFE